MTLEGKVVVLTGVGQKGQVGEAVARAVAESGARTIVVSRSLAEVSARADELRAAGLDARAFACDLSDAAQLATLVADVRAACGDRVDALVNMAGGFGASGPVAESDPAAWQRQVSINLTTAYLTTRAFLPILRSARGAIVFFASAAALPGARVGGTAAYAAAKAGVVVLARAVAQEERATGVRANALAPAAIRTATNVDAMGEDARYIEREDVASAVIFLISDASRAITGQLIALG